MIMVKIGNNIANPITKPIALQQYSIKEWNAHGSSLSTILVSFWILFIILP